MRSSTTTDFLIIGGGIVGLSIARCLKQTFKSAKIIVLEKEPECGWHASGRNSGVLHAGFYYTPDSLKAKFTRIGNELLTSYCKEKGLAIRQCGKLVVTQNAQELASLDILLARGKQNNVPVYEVTEREAKDIEPHARTFERALFSPSTASVNPSEVMQSIRADAEAEGIIIHCNETYIRKEKHTIVTSLGEYAANFVVNAAGLYADKIAQDFGFSKNYRILPFKGIYLYAKETTGIKTHLYPVPNLKNPFLGVHVTVTADGKTKIGPTAIPAFWREQYHLLERFKWRELKEILLRQFGLFWGSEFDFKRLAFDEMKKYSRVHLTKLASELASGIKVTDYKQRGRTGIRAQLLNIKEKKLEMDFILEGDKHSMHVLNAVSPAFTSAFPFAEYVVQKIKENI